MVALDGLGCFAGGDAADGGGTGGVVGDGDGGAGDEREWRRGGGDEEGDEEGDGGGEWWRSCLHVREWEWAAVEDSVGGGGVLFFIARRER